MKTAPERTWTLSLFGRLRLRSSSHVVDQFDTKRSAQLLARLAISHRRTISRADAADMLWPDDFYDATRIRLRQELSRLRRALGPARELLDTDEEWIRLVDVDLTIDSVCFEDAFRRARLTEDDERQEALLREALNLSEEEFLAGQTEPWIELERRRLFEIRYAVLLDLATLVSKRGAHAEALELAREAVRSDPLRETGHLLAMQELGKLGHLTDALDQYNQLKRLLREEAQTTPSEEADRLAAALRAAPVETIVPRSVAGDLTYVVPAPTEPIYGRQGDIAALLKLLDPDGSRVRIVTLTGPGGIGKTRLANELAVQLESAYCGKVAWVAVADLSDAALIPSVIVRILGMTIGQNADAKDRLVALLPKEPLLLVLDNLEQLLPDAATLIKTLAEARPELRILCTSRIPLNVSGERVVGVPALPIPTASDSVDQPALRIFLEPLLADRAFHEPDQRDLAVYRQIAERLEGFPLALQLASARLRTLTPRELLGQLDNRLDALVNRRADAPERHRTLRAALSDSYRSLSPELQQFLGRLAVFRGGWTLGAAAVVCGASDAHPILEALLDSSLIRVDREDHGLRFRMFETIRDYAIEKMTPEERLDAYRRHADWIIQLGRPAMGRIVDPGAVELFKVLDPEVDNIREASRFCLEYDLPRAVQIGGTFGLFWYSRGFGREALRFLTELIAHREELPISRDLAQAAYSRSQLLQASHIVAPGTEGPPAFALAEELCRAAGMRVEEALVKYHRSHTNIAAAEMDQALVLLDEASAMVHVDTEPRDVAFILHGIACIKYYQGKIRESMDLMERAKQIFEEHPTPFSEVQNLQMMSFLYYELKEYDRAWTSATEGLRRAESVGSKHLIPMIQEILGRVCLERGEFEQAIQWARASADGWEAYGNMFQYGDQNHLIGRIEVEMGEPSLALGHLKIAAEHFGRLGVTPFLPLVLHTAAKAWAQLAAPEKATRLLGASDRSIKPTGEQDLGSELEYVTPIREDLRRKLGDARFIEFLNSGLSLDEAVAEAFV